MMLCGLSAWHQGLGQIVVVGDRTHAGTRALLCTLATRYLPFAIVIPVEPGDRQQAIAASLPFIAPMSAPEGAAAYVCRQFTCRQPVSQPEELDALLK